MTLAEIEPYKPYIIMALNGLVAGWIAGKLLGGGGLIRNFFVGIIGALAGGFLVQSRLLNLPYTTGNVWGDQIVISTIGAILVILFARLIAR